ncbi:MAG: Uma2 family endonuclease [Pirellulaceae bacterium]|nr:Uma2 family endonuclease [Pirellulaceae bacterium]
MTPTKINRIPDLVVEILSPSNPDHDLKTKRRLYESAGIPEYWIVFPNEHQVLQLVHVGGRYVGEPLTESICMQVQPRSMVDPALVW